MALGGYIADPSCDRGNSQTQYLFLNGRWIRDRGLFQAVQDAYRGLLMTGRYPVAFLFLELPPDQVDVNVHPTKAEVRFRDKDSLYQLIQQAVSDRLQAADLTARMQLKTRKELYACFRSRICARHRRRTRAFPHLAAGRKELPPARPKEMPSAARSTAPSPEPHDLAAARDGVD